MAQEASPKAPLGWEILNLGKELNQIPTTNKKIAAKSYLPSGNFPVIDQGQDFIAGYCDDEDRLITIEKPIVVFGDHTRAIKYVDFDFVPGADGTKVLVANEYLESKYFYYMLRVIELPDKGYSRHYRYLKEANCLIAPLPEQKRIVEKLDSLLAQVDTIQQRLNNLPDIIKRFRQSVLAAAVSGKLTEQWRGENVTEQSSYLIDKNNKSKTGKLKVRVKKGIEEMVTLFSIPDKWDWIPNHNLAIDESTAICAGPFGTIFKAKDFRDEGVPIIFLRHVKESGFNQRKPNYMDEDVWQEFHQDYSVHGGELLVTKLGDPPGECCIFPENFGTAMVTPDVLKMAVDRRVAEKKYLMHFFNSPLSTKMVKELAFGATRLRIDIPMFKCLPIPLPPLKEQTEIVRLVEQYFALADSLEKNLSNAKQRVDSLTQSILAKAFRGELVPQDANDEPAEQLLARIKAARLEAEKLEKAAKKAAKASKAKKS